MNRWIWIQASEGPPEHTMNAVVYHGSDEPHLDELRAGAAAYRYGGGIGFGCYVAFDPEVAEFYGRYVYRLRLRIPESRILWLVLNDTAEPVASTQESVLVGEHVAPFRFRIGQQVYLVGDAENVREAHREEAAQEFRVAWDRHYRDLPRFGAELTDLVRKFGLEWDEYDFDEAVDGAYDEVLASARTQTGLPDDELDAALARGGALFQRLFDKMLTFARDNTPTEPEIGLELDLDDIGAEARTAGYRAVYLEGVRGRHPDSELLVFDPDDLEMIGLDAEGR